MVSRGKNPCPSFFQVESDRKLASTQKIIHNLEHLAQLRQEHRDLDVAIEALQNAPGCDLLQVQRLKKHRLQLRDRLIWTQDQLTPDLIA